MQIQPYLFFDGRSEEAIGFYESALGAKAEVMRFSQSPQPIPPGVLPPGAENMVMHASLTIGGATVLLSDGRCGGKPEFQGVSLAVTVPDVPATQAMFDALAVEGKVTMALHKTFWSPLFGSLVDKFGVSWMIMAAPEG